MRKTNYLFFLSSLAIFSVFGAGEDKHRNISSHKDVFQTSYFLKNVPGLISPFKGSEIRYFADHERITVYLIDAGLIYKLSRKDENKNGEAEREKNLLPKDEEEEENVNILSHYATMNWIGANPHPRIEATAKNMGYYTFLSKEEHHSLITDAYSKVTYHDLYPGIDVEYYLLEKGGMKYDIIVHPGADISQVRMRYGASSKKISRDEKGNIFIHTANGDIEEHAPIAYSDNGIQFRAYYVVNSNTITFSLPDGYDRSKTLTIDPWVTLITQLTVRNLGTSVDYDLAGNLYVYGAGAANVLDLTNYQKVAKYDPNGNFLWVFGGSVPAVSWNTVCNACGGLNLLSDARVDKATNKVYVSQALSGSGIQIIRLTSSGSYDNFISTPNSDFVEGWSLINDCVTGSILALGGGTTSNLNMGVIDPVSGTVSTSNFTGFGGNGQDIVSGTYDTYGYLYTILASGPAATPSVNNVIFKVNSQNNGYIWKVATGYNTFHEAYNLPGFSNYGSNHYNALAANGSYLYYYDGKNLKAFDLATGNTVGTPASIFVYDTLYQGGIAVDDCNNVYVGGLGLIKTFTFNGINFLSQPDIPLGLGFSGDSVYDVRYNASNNLLYVVGSQIAGTYQASLSTSCIQINTFTDTITALCNEATVKITPSVTLSDPVFSFLWEDSMGNIIRQTPSDTILTDTIRGLNLGKYTLQIQLNLNCGGAMVTDSFSIICNELLYTHDTIICGGQSVTLVATGIPGGGTYNWMPGGANTSSITVSPTVSTNYIVTYIPISGNPIIDTIKITVNQYGLQTIVDSAFCAGQLSVINIQPDNNFIFYSPIIYLDNGLVTTVNDSTSGGVHYISVTNSQGCVLYDTVSLPVIIPLLSDTIYTSSVRCNGGADGVIDIGTQGGNAPYIYQWSGIPGETNNMDTMLIAGTYTIIIKDAKGCADTVSASITQPSKIDPLVINNSSCHSNNNAIIIASATGGIPPYSYSIDQTNNFSAIDTFTSLQGGTHTITIRDANDCDTTVSFYIYQSDNFALSIINQSCYSSNDGQIIITPITNYYSPYSYSLNGQSTTSNNQFTALAPGNYTLAVQDSLGCDTIFNISILSAQAYSLALSPGDSTINAGESIHVNSVLSPMPPGIISYQWSPNTGLSCSDCANPIIQTNISQNYTLVIKYNNCQISDTINVIVQNDHALYIPNAFTPNGDGINDIFLIYGKDITYFNLQIFDRWGEKVSESNDENIGWDGKYKGSLQAPGLYIYILSISFAGQNAAIYKGSIALIR
jgi:gliding motility-associated-like protein